MALGQFYIALVDPEETSFLPEHAREDVGVASFSLAQKEGDFTIFTMVIKNPLQGLLAPARKRHAWISWHSPSGVVPLMFGRIVGVPTDINKMRTVITIRARPDDYVDVKAALAETLKEAPYWDEVWVHPDNLDDPDFVIQARSARYHVDRITHAVTISDMLVPEDGTLEFDADDGVVGDSVNITYAGSGKSRVHVRGEVSWTQRALGTIDVSKKITDAFAAAGTPYPGMVSSYSWEHLAESWPLPGDDIGGGWKWFDANIEMGNNRWVTQEDVILNTLSLWATSYFGAIGEQFGFGFPQQEEQVRVDVTMGVFKPTMVAQYTAERSRTEVVEFDMVSDIQPVLGNPDDDSPVLISLSSNDVGEPIESDESGNTQSPIEDPRRSAYLKTDRGVRSVDYLMARARAELIDHARIVNITFTVPFRHLPDVTLRKSAILHDPRLPGGQAQGKIVAYSAAGDTQSGLFSLTITIACAIGYGNSVAAVAGDPVYVADGYVQAGYQQREGTVALLGSGDFAYDDYRGYAVDDDGVDLFNPSPEELVLSVVVTNGPEQQEAELSTNTLGDGTEGFADFSVAGTATGIFKDKEEVKTELAKVRTQVCVDFKPVAGGPFLTEFEINTYPLVIPKQIDLEAA